VIVAQVARLELLKPEERLNPDQLIADLKAAGKNAAYLPDVDSIVTHAGTHVQPGDVVCVFSNGGFGDIHQKLLARFGRK
jgi:UDP-N-acetylmuramate: L-alanyl-gamma-D-glutamyl-meso-diaminopimelate ligase